MNILDDATLVRQELERRLTPEHVDQHLSEGELAIVAGLYAAHSAGGVLLKNLPADLGQWESLPVAWPAALHSTFWRGGARRSRLIAYSVAFLAMEADRLERAKAAQRAAR